MGTRPLLLGLDVGTTRIKALLVDGGGEDRSIATASTPFAATAAGVEMAPVRLQSALVEVLEGLGPQRARVAAVGVAGIAESGAPVDAAGRALAPVIAWHDPRGAEVVARLEQRLGDSLALRTGQRLRTVSSAAKLGWLLDDGVTGVATWLGVPELCLFQLTGARATEHSLASRTGWYDVGERCYLPEVAETCGFGLDVLPPVLPAGQAMGRVTPAAAGWSGLPDGIPVTVAGHDHLAGAEGLGGGATAFNSVGTAETVLRHHDALPEIEEALALSVAVSVRPRGTGWCLLASAVRAGSVLERASKALGRSPAELDDLAVDARPAEVDELLHALQEGEEPEVEGSPGEIWRGLLRALSARTAEAAERLARLAGPAQRLVVFGGGSRSEPWLREKAAAVRVPLSRVAVPEAVARGAAMMAGVSAGWWTGPDEFPPPALESVPPA